MNDNSLSSACVAVLRRDFTLIMRHRNDLINPITFFVIIVTLFPLALGPDQSTLKQLAPGIIWVAALIATTMSMDAIFRSDFEDGTLEQMIMSHHSTTALVMAKIFAHWLVTGFLVTIVAALLGALLYLPMNAIGVLQLTLLFGTPILSMVGAIAVALTVGLPRSGVLLALLILPLYIPVLIFATAAVNNATLGLAYNGQLYFLAALLVLSLTLAPIATAASLRISMG
jgi:heme exporter protein B